MCRLMSNPYDGLDPRFNGMLMQIFECYRNASDEKVQLHVQLDDEITRRKALLQALQHSQKLWSEEREDYKSEVKRLELLLAKGKRGLAEVTFARQDSELRQKNDDRRSMLVDNGLETIFELLERTNRYDDKAWSSQRGMCPSFLHAVLLPCYPPPPSPLTAKLYVLTARSQSSNQAAVTFSADEKVIPAAHVQEIHDLYPCRSTVRHTTRGRSQYAC